MKPRAVAAVSGTAMTSPKTFMLPRRRRADHRHAPLRPLPQEQLFRVPQLPPRRCSTWRQSRPRRASPAAGKQAHARWSGPAAGSLRPEEGRSGARLATRPAAPAARTWLRTAAGRRAEDHEDHAGGEKLAARPASTGRLREGAKSYAKPDRRRGLRVQAPRTFRPCSRNWPCGPTYR